MKKTLLLGALLVSVTANAWLWTARRHAPSGPSEIPAAPATTATTAAVIAGSTDTATPTTSQAEATTSQQPMIWSQPTTEADYRALAAKLRAAGFPSHLIYTVLGDLYRAQAMAQSPLGRAPYWQRRGIEQSAEMFEFRRTLRNQLEDILGPDARRSSTLTAVERARRYGSLSDAKIDALAKIERDYEEMQTDVYRTSRGMSSTMQDYANQQRQVDLLTSEKRADLAAVLTPAELEEYELHNSAASRKISRAVQELTLTDDEFAALSRAQKVCDDNTPQLSSTTLSSEQMAQRQAAQLALYSQVQSTLADDRFYQYLQTTDTTYRTISALGSQYATVTPAAAYEVMKLQNEVQQTMRSLSQNRALSGETYLTTIASLNSRLEALIGTEAAAAYRKTSGGRMFNTPVIRRSKTTGN